MTTANVSAFLRRLTRGMVAETLADQSDRQLVEQFLAERGEAVFEAIVRRHGAMVYRVCWRVLQHLGCPSVEPTPVPLITPALDAIKLNSF